MNNENTKIEDTVKRAMELLGTILKDSAHLERIEQVVRLSWMDGYLEGMGKVSKATLEHLDKIGL